MNSGEEAAVIALVKEVFNEFVAPDYELDGINEFFQFANPETIKDRIRNEGFVLVAEHKEKLVGVLEFFPPDCIAMLFVSLRNMELPEVCHTERFGRFWHQIPRYQRLLFNRQRTPFKSMRE